MTSDDEPTPSDEPVGDEPVGDEPVGDEPAGDEPADAQLEQSQQAIDDAREAVKKVAATDSIDGEAADGEEDHTDESVG